MILFNERQLKAVKYVKGKGKIANREYQKLNDCSRNTASNDLRELTQKIIFKKKRNQRSRIVLYNCTINS